MNIHVKGQINSHHIDIMKYLNPQELTDHQSYFDLNKHQATHEGFKSLGFSLLCTELCSEGIRNGYKFV